jgi:histidine triad (HIT) family protein
MSNKCLFCGIAAKEIPADIVYEDNDILAFRDINPKAPLHILVIPRKHIETLNDIGVDDAMTVGRIFLKIRDIASREGISTEGYRVVANCNRAAGQEVFHVHFHLMGGRDFSWPPG